MTLAISLIFLFITSFMSLGAMENNVLNQKMSAGFQAQVIAFNTAEAGLVAAEAKINGETVDLSNLKGDLNYQITNDVLDNCQQHIFTIISSATYQNAHIKLTSTYLKARDPPLPDCSANQNSHQLWWQQLDF